MLLENLTCRNALEEKNLENVFRRFVMDKKSWKTWKSNPKIVMDEEIGSERRDG